MGPHTGFIVASFATTAVVLGGLVAAVLIDARVQRRALARLRTLNPARAPVRDAARQDEPE